MAKHEFNIPERMKHLPIDERGYPIPYFVPYVNGKPEFRYQDFRKREICIQYKKCAICGGRLLDKQFWFISGTQGKNNRISSDYAMHEECARFSISVCPHLILKKAQRRSDVNDVRVDADPAIDRGKPEELFLVRADKIREINEGGANLYQISPGLRGAVSLRGK